MWISHTVLTVQCDHSGCGESEAFIGDSELSAKQKAIKAGWDFESGSTQDMQKCGCPEHHCCDNGS